MGGGGELHSQVHLRPIKSQPRDLTRAKRAVEEKKNACSSVIKTADAVDNVIAAVTNDSHKSLWMSAGVEVVEGARSAVRGGGFCNVSTFCSEPQHLSTARQRSN